MKTSSITTNLCITLVLCLSPSGLVPMPAHASIRTAAPEGIEQRSAPGWLREAARLEARGEHAQAGEAYRQALLALSERRQRGEEGATAALYAAKAHWRAFDLDPDAARLAAAIDVLELWLGLGGAQDATIVDELRGESGRLRAILEPLRSGDAAFEAGDALEACRRYDEALAAVPSEPRDWSTGANLAVTIAERFVTRYDASFASATDVEPRLQELRSVQRMLEGWRSKQPPGKVERGESLAHALAGVRGRVAEGERALFVEPERPTIEKPEPIPTRPVVTKGTGLIVGASVITGLAWVGTSIRSGAAIRCRAGEYSCSGGGGNFVTALTPLGWGLDASSYVLGALAGARRGQHDGVAAAWDGAPQRRPQMLKGMGAMLLSVGVAGRVASIGLWFANVDVLCFGGCTYDGSYMTFHPFLAQLSASAVSAGGGILAYGVAYDRRRAIEEPRRHRAGRVHPPNQSRSGTSYAGAILVSAGVAVTGTGVALMAEGVERWRRSTSEASAAASLESMHDGVYGIDSNRYDDASFDADLKVARRSISGLLLGSYVLVATGIATSIGGLTVFANARPASRAKRRAWIRPSTVVSPGLSLLTVSGRF